jgi:hypothetical protein
VGTPRWRRRSPPPTSRWCRVNRMVLRGNAQRNTVAQHLRDREANPRNLDSAAKPSHRGQAFPAAFGESRAARCRRPGPPAMSAEIPGAGDDLGIDRYRSRRRSRRLAGLLRVTSTARATPGRARRPEPAAAHPGREGAARGRRQAPLLPGGTVVRRPVVRVGGQSRHGRPRWGIVRLGTRRAQWLTVRHKASDAGDG